MIETLLDFSGLEDISRDLQLLSGAENNRVLREATRAGANVLKEEVVSRAPVRRGKTAPQCGGPFPALPRWRDGIRCAYPGC
ncbi:putative structural component HK97 gp of phage origin [Escherichia coli]|uniref:Putative structural component HK97 gp of phage origin n=1 Tax=Escherichia coli TaxID=562 RepID=A0A377EGN4_ECOLX|nr:putative structural component HK97 gp of phage origin [Escherichia coli]